MEKFDYIKSPLKGVNLIEASAGTGKTYTLSMLFVRLILEENLSVDQILVVTFTRAATEELRDRIRKRVYGALQALKNEKNDLPELNHVDNKILSVKDAADRLKKAIEDFDRASIFTIHSFCQKILYENAFEAGSLFDAELVSDQYTLLRGIAEDFWRKHFYDAPEALVMYAAGCKIKGPDYFIKLFNNKRSPDIRIMPQLERPDTVRYLKAYSKDFEQFRNEWKKSKEIIYNLLKSAPLNGVSYGALKQDKKNPVLTGREIKLLRFFEGMESFLSDKTPSYPLFEDFKYFTESFISEKINKNGTPPSHPFFEACDKFLMQANALQGVLDNFLLFLKAEFFRYAEAESVIRKRDDNIKFFDDLLVQVRNALKGEGGRALSASVRNIYKAALVDEFQDTDFIQSEIFSRLFSASDAPLFMIGDPKQAIYSFRGADVFSYIRASNSAENRYTLEQNFRSTPGMIDAVNTLFYGHHIPFVLKDIPFARVSPGKKKAVPIEIFKTPLTFWFFGKDGEKAIPKDESTRIISGAVSDEILNLVNEKTDKNSNQIKPGDIAILVRTNKQAVIVKQALSAKHIPAVLYCDEDVFHTREALEIERILSSIAEPLNEGKFRAAVVTDLIGVSGEHLVISETPSSLLEKLRADFYEYHRLWLKYGFIRMFRRFLSQSSVRSRLLGFSDGERRLTNLLHIAELIHQCEFEKRLSVAATLKWISEKRSSDNTAIEEHQLRLESDARAVKILTMHKSKGLEFPIVFCPFCWSRLQVKNDVFCYHDADCQDMVLDIGSDNKASSKIKAGNEELAEDLRLLYVALTRSKYKCYLAWGWINGTASSSLAYLLHHKIDQIDWKQEDITGNLDEAVSSKDGEALYTEISDLAAESKNIELKALDDSEEVSQRYKSPEQIQPEGYRKFHGRISSRFRIASYSALASTGGLHAQPVLDHDRILNKHEFSFSADTETNFNSIYSFPKGARAGIFFHDIFEHLDFTNKDTDSVNQLIAEKLKLDGFDQNWQKTVYDMVRSVITIPLNKDDTHFLLSNINPGERLNEMEFYFPLKRITPSLLKECFKDHHTAIPETFPEQMGQLSFSPTEGYLKGFIDLVFRYEGKYYLLDWKSNFLGGDPESYNQTSVSNTMLEDNYIFQYCLYTLALHLFLKSRIIDYDYNTYFGGVYYLFIRGIGQVPESEHGIYFDLPDEKLIAAMEKTMIRTT